MTLKRYKVNADGNGTWETIDPSEVDGKLLRFKHSNIPDEIDETYTESDYLLDHIVLITVALAIAVLVLKYSGAADALLAWIELI
jgi:hypothetical protein